MIILSIPILLPIVLVIKLEDGGPVFYNQEKALDPGRERLPISAQG